jgi:hypothetical protein
MCGLKQINLSGQSFEYLTLADCGEEWQEVRISED